MTHVCPIHERVLRWSHTRYGRRYACPVAGCTVVCWEGSTSTPADLETREARKALHLLFDKEWKEAHGLFDAPNCSRRERRNNAYRWLSKEMGLPGVCAHIGMFDLEQCERATSLLTKATSNRDASQQEARQGGSDRGPRGGA